MVFKRISISKQVKDFVLNKIVEGLIKPGERIIESNLAKELNVSNIPVREAIQELVVMGVLKSEPHKGAWLRKVSLGETIDALNVKAVLEQKAILLGNKRLQEKLSELDFIAGNTLKAAKGKNYALYGKYNHKFHRLLIETSDNQLLIKYWEALSFEVCDAFILKVLKKKDTVEIAKDHQRIVDAIRIENYQKASVLALEHANKLIHSLENISKLNTHSLYEIFDMEN